MTRCNVRDGHDLTDEYERKRKQKCWGVGVNIDFEGRKLDFCLQAEWENEWGMMKLTAALS